MEHIEYVYTVGMADEAVREHLETTETGVLALASDGDAYAIPVAHHYESGSLYVRLSTDGSSSKLSSLENTETACFTMYDVSESGDSWSVVVTGPLRKLTGRERAQFDETAVNESFLELRIFDEDIAAVDLEIYELEIEAVTGRRTGD